MSLPGTVGGAGSQGGPRGKRAVGAPPQATTSTLPHCLAAHPSHGRERTHPCHGREPTNVNRETCEGLHDQRRDDQVAIGLFALAVGLDVALLAQVLVDELALARRHRVQGDRAT
jgi:hypothetical protein